MNHMMVDLETLDTRPSTVILSIGACIFNEAGPLLGSDAKLYVRCSWQDQIDAGRTVSESTIRWWMQQSDAARAALDGETFSLSRGLMDLKLMYYAQRCDRIWANGTTFDISILDHAYAGAQPWKYNAMRDMRGLRDLVPSDIMDDVENVTAHDALSDAIYQAEFVVRALKFLRRT